MNIHCYCTKTNTVFWGIKTPHAVPLTKRLYDRMLRATPSARRALYVFRVMVA